MNEFLELIPDHQVKLALKIDLNDVYKTTHPAKDQFAYLNKTLSTGRTLLHLAADTGNLSAVEYLLFHGANPTVFSEGHNNSAAYFAARNGHIAILKKLIPAYPTLLNHRNSSGETPILAAVKIKKMDCIAYLLEQQCNLNLASNYGRTPLSVAVSQGNLALAYRLISYGATISDAVKPELQALCVNIKPYDFNDDNQTPLMTALFDDKTENKIFFKFLLEFKKPTYLEINNFIQEAIKRDQTWILKYLLLEKTSHRILIYQSALLNNHQEILAYIKEKNLKAEILSGQALYNFKSAFFACLNFNASKKNTHKSSLANPRPQTTDEPPSKRQRTDGWATSYNKQ